MRFMAEELREYMARLGVRTVDELVGRTDLLKVKDAPAGSARERGGPELHPVENPDWWKAAAYTSTPRMFTTSSLEKTPDDAAC